MVLSFTAYSRSDHNRMPGNEFGSAKWGEVREFNEKYAAKTADGEGDLSPEIKCCHRMYDFGMIPILFAIIMCLSLVEVVPVRPLFS